MNFRLSFFMSILLVVGFCHPIMASAQAAPDAERRVEDLLQQLRDSGDPAVILDYVDWESAFQSLRGSERVRMGVSTPTELYQYMRHTAPRYQNEGNAAPGALQATQYQVLGSEMRGPRAVVRFVSTLNGQKKEQHLELVRRGSEWFLPNPDLRLSGQ